MVKIKSFNGWRPAKELAKTIAAPPYDVLSSAEAKILTANNAQSFLRVTKPEVDFEDDIDVYSSQVYQKGKSNWADYKSRRWFIQDEEDSLYIYRQGINGHFQTGIVAVSSIDDYFNGIIKKHEFTRPQKENDRIEHTFTVGIHPGPVFLTYKKHEQLDELVNNFITTHSPENDFIAADGVSHTLWHVHDASLIRQITIIFKDEIPATYIADGHHRAAASSKVGLKLRETNPDVEASHNYFLSVLFPDNQLKIMDYNRLVKDLNGWSSLDFLKKIEENFEVIPKGNEIFKPSNLHEFSMYLEENWYQLKAKAHTIEENHPINCLDVTILSDYLIAPILGIADQRTDNRIDFVGGIRGLGELKNRVDSGEMKIAFALFPVSIQQLIDIADAGEVMPPKSTWFEPKLRSGLVVHEFRKE
jgi:uncharacterized protein (DUF1015 family)